MSHGLVIYDPWGRKVLDSRDHVWNVAAVFFYPGGNADITRTMAAELQHLPGQVMVVSTGSTAGSTLQYTLSMSSAPPRIRMWGGERSSTVYVMVM
jgi:hypothetical protein